MKLQTRLALLLAHLALIPLLFVSYLSYLHQREALLQLTVEQLVSTADIQERRINQVLEGYLDQVRSVAASNDLQNKFLSGGDARAVTDRLKNALPSVHDIILHAPGVQIVSSATGEGFVERSQFELVEVYKNEENKIRVRLLGPVVRDGQRLGTVEVVMSADAFLTVTDDYAGLGDTGEVLLVKKNLLGDTLFLTPVRFDSGAAFSRGISKENGSVLSVRAASGEEDIFFSATELDYRGVPVVGVTRYIDSLGWGVVVKIDRAEALSPVSELARTYAAALIISAMAVLFIAYLTARAVTRPVEELTSSAKSLQDGDFSVRSKVVGNDEIAALGNAFNKMAENLQESYQHLEQKVRERTTKLAEAKAQDDAVLSSVAEGIVVVNKEGEFVFFNRQAELLLGSGPKKVRPEEWPEAYNVYHLSEDRLMRFEEVRSFQAIHGGAVVGERVRVKHPKTGEFTVLRINAAPVSVGKTVTGVVFTFIDVSREQEVDRAKTEFVSLASHQLRTPLSTINWYAEMLLEGDAGNLTAEQEKYLMEIYTGNQRMVALVNALLNVSRLELGTFTVEPEPVRVVELMQSVVDEQMPQIKERKITLNTSFDESTPVMQIDPKLWRMVYQNLLSNAVKYTSPGGSVSLSIKQEGDYVVTEVADTGWGIPESQHDKIFTKLFRADNVRAQDTEGTGLGLYIVKSIVEHSGGMISFDSKEGEGTTFHVSLPKVGMVAKKGTKKLDG